MGYTIKEGDYEEYGVQVKEGGVIFTFEAEKEDECEILLYDREYKVTETIPVPERYCRGAIRSVCINGLDALRLKYNYKINGQIVTDSYASRIVGREHWNDPRRAKYAWQVCGGYAPCDFDWQEDVMPEVPRREMVMYKINVRGFSMDAGIRGSRRGTFAAVRERIPYLKELGITTVEFMPVYEFEENVLPKQTALPEYLKWQAKEGDMITPEQPEASEKVNLWGYVPGNYFAVKASYAGAADAAWEWKELVRQLHANGMECVMEMYFTGSENQNMILDALRYWVREYHVDGFHLLGEKLPITQIAQDAWLRRTKIFYTGYDPMLLEGKCSYPHLFIYSDEYLYPVRAMLNHMNGSLEAFACQQRKQHRYHGFVNYIADNNGFTLNDLFCYAEKHNEANGEDNCDGSNWNLSSNYGVEGRSMRRLVRQIRERQMRNAIAILMLGQGVPLLFEGDEQGNSQEGNNNAYCQDNRIGWVNWKRNRSYAWLTDFTREMIAFRKAHPVLAAEEPKTLNDAGRKGFPDLSYHGENAWISSLTRERQSVGMMYCGAYEKREDGTADADIYVGYNFHTGTARLALPKLPGKRRWYLCMDTARSAQPFLAEEERIEEAQIAVKGEAVVILVGK
ncbi:MAG: glycogen operon protein GlgX [Roseburia sp.]|nr:glycogen operon protein GlgX [Roseburia sp.]